MKSINKLEIGKELAETIMVLAMCIAFCIVVKFIDVKESHTIQSIEQLLESIEKTVEVNSKNQLIHK